MFDNFSEFKRDFTPLIKYFDIKPVSTPVKNPQSHAPVEQVHQIILKMLVTKDFDEKVFDYIYPWGETPVYIAGEIISYYHRTIMATSGQAVFGRYMLFNLAPVVDWRVVTAANQHQLDIDNVKENANQVTHDYAVGDQVYV